MGSLPGPHSSRVAAIQSLFQQWTPLLHPTKSPEEEFQEKYKEAQAHYATAVARQLEAQQATFDANLDHVLSCGNRLKKLTAEHEAHREDEERKYQQLHWNQQEALVLRLLDEFGPQLGDELCNKWREHAQLPLNNPAQPDAVAGSSVEVTTNSYVTPNASPVLQSLHPPNPTAQNATNETAPILPTAESSRDQGTRTADRSPDEAQRSSKAQQKRPASPPQGNTSRPAKRSRSNAPQPRGPLTGDRSIDFDDVYQDGNAETNYIITKHKGFWYILECKEHNLHFMSNNPIHGARRHLTAEAHGSLNANHDETVRLLGTRVLNCDEDLAKLNNEVAQRPTYAHYGRPLSSVSAGSAHSNNEGPQTRSTQFLTGIDPQPGEVYTTFWKETKRFYAILVLPWGSFRPFGWDMNLKDNTGLLKKKIPTCYNYDPVTETVEWAELYRPGGKYHHKRKYPVMYIDAPVFPWECAVGWVPVNEFHPYDPNDEGIPHKDKVDEFILGMEERDRLRNGGEELGAAEHKATDKAPVNVSDQQQSTEVEQPPLGSSMRLAIEIPDDDSDTEEGPGMMPQDADWMSEEPRVKIEKTNEEAPTKTSDVAATQIQANSIGSDDAGHQWNDTSRTPTIPDSGSGLGANGMLNTAVPNTPVVENPNNSSSSAPPRPGRQIYDDLVASCWKRTPSREQQTVPIDETSQSAPRAPEAVMTPGNQNHPPAAPQGANGPGTSAPFARMNDYAAFENSAPLELYGYLAHNYTANTTADVAGNGGLRWMTPARGPSQTATEVTRDREIDIRNAAARRGNWRQPFVSDDTD